MLTLYDFGNSVCCQKVRITMRAKGLDWESVKVDLFKAEQYDPKYLKLNPKGIVPTLVHDGKAIITPARRGVLPPARREAIALDLVQLRIATWRLPLRGRGRDGAARQGHGPPIERRVKRMDC